MISIRRLQAGDSDAIWAMLEPVIREGESYALPLDSEREAGLAYWLGADHRVFVAELDGVLIGSYYIRANQQGGGAHVCNCGYVTDTRFRGRGVARAMCMHSLEEGKAAGFRAMQFNFVVATNTAAVHLWGGCGFRVLAKLPGAFLHPRLGYVDALVMWRELCSDSAN